VLEPYLAWNLPVWNGAMIAATVGPDGASALPRADLPRGAAGMDSTCQLCAIA
jgi:hypothetical protein